MGWVTRWLSVFVVSLSLACVNGGTTAFAQQKNKTTQTKQVQKKKTVKKTVVKKSSATKPKNTKKTTRNKPKKVTAAAAPVKKDISSPVVAYAGSNVGLRAGSVKLESESVLVLDQKTGMPILAKNETKPKPIASITKLMTAMVVLDAKLSMDEQITITDADVDRLKYSSSRVDVGSKLPRREVMKLALMSSDNRAAHALGRTYPGGVQAFVKAMNKKAKALGMHSARFVDPAGLSPRNVASPKDLAVMVSSASKYNTIRKLSTHESETLRIKRKTQTFGNTNPLVHSNAWDIAVSKTGYIREAGRCLVMYVNINNRPTMIVLLNGARTSSRVMDSLAIKNWLSKEDTQTALKAADLMFSVDTVTLLAEKGSV